MSKKKTMKVETYLPVFPGFYGTMFEPNFTRLLEDYNVNWEDVKFDFDQYKKTFGEYACSFIAENLKEYVTYIEFEEVYSPRYYNFSNDAIHCKITLTKENCKNIAHTIKTFPSAWKDYLKTRFTHCSGFISFHSNKPADWKINTSNYTDFSGNAHWLGTVLEFIAMQIEYIQEGHLCDYIEESERHDKLMESVIIPNHGQILLNKVFNVPEFKLSMVNFHALPHGETMLNDITDIQNCRTEDDFKYLDFDPQQRALEIFQLVHNHFLSPTEEANNLKLDLHD